MGAERGRGVMGEERARKVTIERLGLIGDVHTEQARLQRVLRFFATQPLDAVVCTGDLPDGPADARAIERCCELLRDAGVLTVSGNHDRWLLDGEMRDLDEATPSDDLPEHVRAFLRALPPMIELRTTAGLALLCHGLGDDDMGELQPFDRGRELDDNASLQGLLRERRYTHVLHGHTHRAMVRTIDGVTFITGGTLLGDHSPCCTIIDFASRRVRSFAIRDDGNIEEAGDAPLPV